MSKEEVMEMIKVINSMSQKEFGKLLDDTEKDILTKETYEELKEMEN